MKSGIAHIGMYCKDLEKVKMFYENYFGAQSIRKYTNPVKGFESYMLSFGDGACRLELMRKVGVDAVPLSAALGFAHVSLSVGSKAGVDAITDLLRGDGYKILDGPRTTGDGFYESTVADPEGNLVEITV